LTWLDLFERWSLVDADLHAEFGVDIWDEALLTSRPWPWLRNRVLGLLSADTRLRRALTPTPPPPSR